MLEIDKLAVFIDFGSSEMVLGQIVKNGKSYYFKYAEEYLKVGYNISPFKLRLDNSVQLPDTTIFEGLFGVFADSLPDGWGRLLTDRFLQNNGYNLGNISPLARLSLVGNNGIGALKYKPIFQTETQEGVYQNLDDLYESAMSIYDDQDSDEVDAFFSFAGSSGGARPKVWIYYNNQTKAFSSKKQKDFEPWIIKFASSHDVNDIGTVEYIYSLMAKKAGVSMSDTKLFEGKSGNKYFGTKRFDSDGNNRFHMISAAGLLHDNFRHTALDYGHLMDASFRLTQTVESYEEILKLAVLNVLIGNKDDHSKNFAFLMDGKGNWNFAPAYDLTFAPTSHGYQSTSVDGTSKSIRLSNFISLANHFGMQTMKLIYEEVLEGVNSWHDLSKQFDLSVNTKMLISKTINNNIKEFLDN